jgi:cobalt-zinc-cadmium efflux system outer membrane protein
LPRGVAVVQACSRLAASSRGVVRRRACALAISSRFDPGSFVMQAITLFLLLSGGDPADTCRGPLTRDDVIECARRNSPSVLADRELVAGAKGYEREARVVLPENPEIEFSAAYREGPGGQRAANYYGRLTQEVEIAGQRRRRIAAAQADREATSKRVEVTERDVIADALVAYYDAIAARRELEVLEGTVQTAKLLEDVARERARAGAAAPIEIDLAEAEKAGVHEQAELARGRMEMAQTRLAILVGLEPGARPQLRGDLDPLPVAIDRIDDEAIADRPELAEVGARQKAARARLGLLQRTRAPNLRFHLFVQNDGFDELVLGGGLSLPIPLPAPLGRTNKGAIEAARADIRETEARRDAVRRDITLEAAMAERQLAARRRAAAAYDDEAIARARKSLQDLADQAAAGRLDLRDALATQRTLLELLLRQVRAQHELCRAAVALSHALDELRPRGKGSAR